MSLIMEVGDMFNAIAVDVAARRPCAMVHGCNAQGVMGSGVAKIVRDNYGFAYIQYKHEHKFRGLKLGQVVKSTSPNKRAPIIYNAITQERFGRDGKVYVCYDAVVVALQAVAVDLPKGAKLHLPLIGGGLGGGDRKRLVAVFQAALYNVDATLWEVE